MYPLLKGLLKEGLVKSGRDEARGVAKNYVLTKKGAKELNEVRQMIAGVGRKELVMSRLFSELLPGQVFVPMMVRRYRDGTEVFRQKASELPESERTPLLKELRLAMESQLAWIDRQLDASTPAAVMRSKVKPQV